MLLALSIPLDSCAFEPVIVGVYGFGFIRAGGHVIALFATRGLLLAEEGMLISVVLYLASALSIC